MHFSAALEIFFAVIGGLGIFLLGMKNMSEGLQTIAGNRLRRLVSIVTTNRFMATGVGCMVTAIVQSSSVTSVMTVGFVNSGLMTLRQAIGVIMGANIGTTFTGWILVLAVGKYGLPLLGLAALFLLFSKQERVQYIAMTLMGVGMVFFGLELMSDGFKPLRSMPEFVQWFHMFNADTYAGVLKCALAGCVLTLVVQSSSATLGITMGLASTGVIEFETAAALVLGENIGTTITAFLASIGTSTNARRVAWAHVLFNSVGVVYITALFPLYLHIILTLIKVDPNTVIETQGTLQYPFVRAGIAAVHTGFNVFNTLVFLPLLPVMAKGLERLIPDKPYHETPRLTALKVSSIVESPMVVIEQSRLEVLQMGSIVHSLLDDLRGVITPDDPDEATVRKVFRREETLDTIQREIVEFLTHHLSEQMPTALAAEAHFQMRRADEYESVSDYITTITKLKLRLHKADLPIPDDMLKDVLDLHDSCCAYFDLVYQAHLDRNTGIMAKARPQGEAITHLFRSLRARNLERIATQGLNPQLVTACADVLNAYRKIKDHLVNIAETIAGEK